MSPKSASAGIMLLAGLAACPACAQSESAATAITPFAESATDGGVVVAPSPPANAASNLDLPIEQIAGSTGGCDILDKDFPGLREHPMYDFFKSMTLKQVAALSRGKITADMLAQAQSDLARMDTSPEGDGAVVSGRVWAQ
ncbi:MAG TPA: hypothetical protein VG819_07515 [Rhizomicrobium sp.]|nr:hypothetical protein [Rhizomicrobium sp.]